MLGLMGSRPTRNEIQERRRRAVALFERECAPTKVARELGISRTTAYDWHRTWREQGAMGLELAPRRGRPRDVSEEQLARVRDALIEGPLAHGLRTWTLVTIAELIHRMAGVRYHPARYSLCLSNASLTA